MHEKAPVRDEGWTAVWRNFDDIRAFRPTPSICRPRQSCLSGFESPQAGKEFSSLTDREDVERPHLAVSP